MRKRKLRGGVLERRRDTEGDRKYEKRREEEK